MPSSLKSFIIASDHYSPEIVGGAEIIAKLQADLLKEDGQEVSVVTSVHEYGQATEADYAVNRQRVRTQPHARAIIQKLSRDAQVRGVETSIIFHNIKYFGHEILLLNSLQARKTAWIHDFYYLCDIGTGISDPNSEDCLSKDRCICINNSIENFLERESKLYSLSKVDSLISPSKYLASVFNKITGQAIKHISNSIFLDLAKIRPQQHNSYCKNSEPHLQILWTGYHGWHKGVADAVKIIKSIRNKNGWCLTILGDGELHHKFAELQKDLGTKRIHLVGKVNPESSYEYIRSCDLLLHPSIWAENEPISILIAKKFNKFIAGYRIGGTAELLFEYPFSVIATKGNWEELAKEISQLLEKKFFVESRTNPKIVFEKENSLDSLISISDNFSRMNVDAIWLTGETNSWAEHNFEIHHSWRMFRPKEEHIFDDIGALAGLVLAGNNYSSRLMRLAISRDVPIFAPMNLQMDNVWNRYIYRFSNLDELVWIIEKRIGVCKLEKKSKPSSFDNNSFIHEGDYGWHE